MSVNLFHGDEKCCGAITSGGTEVSQDIRSMCLCCLCFLSVTFFIPFSGVDAFLSDGSVVDSDGDEGLP